MKVENTDWKENTVNKTSIKIHYLVHAQIKIHRNCREDAEKQSLEFLHMYMQVTEKSSFLTNFLFIF